MASVSAWSAGALAANTGIAFASSALGGGKSAVSPAQFAIALTPANVTLQGVCDSFEIADACASGAAYAVGTVVAVAASQLLAGKTALNNVVHILLDDIDLLEVEVTVKADIATTAADKLEIWKFASNVADLAPTEVGTRGHTTTLVVPALTTRTLKASAANLKKGDAIVFYLTGGAAAAPITYNLLGVAIKTYRHDPHVYL